MIGRTTSTRDITGAGLKKWMPHTFSGRPVSIASSTTGSVDVLVAITVWSLHTRSSSWKRCFFTAMSSTTDSITRSHSASSARSEVAVTRLRAASRSASWTRPFSTCLARDFSMPARVESAVDCDLERSTTSKPCSAAHSAMPDPMIPDPTMPRRVTDMERYVTGQ